MMTAIIRRRLSLCSAACPFWTRMMVSRARAQILMEEVPKFEGMRDVGDLLIQIAQSGDPKLESYLDAVLFQVAWSLVTAQKRAPAFRHNDLHRRNVLLTPQQKDGMSIKIKLVGGQEIERVFIGGPRITIIDYDRATWPSGRVLRSREAWTRADETAPGPLPGRDLRWYDFLSFV